jgi:hypothetical protein
MKKHRATPHHDNRARKTALHVDTSAPNAPKQGELQHELVCVNLTPDCLIGSTVDGLMLAFKLVASKQTARKP